MVERKSVIQSSFAICPFRKSYPDVLMMQSGQDWNGDNDTGPLDCSMQGRIHSALHYLLPPLNQVSG
jgi:hypothetical protein